MYYRAAYDLTEKYRKMSEEEIIARANFVIHDSGATFIFPYLVGLNKLFVVFDTDRRWMDFAHRYFSDGLGISVDRNGIQEISPVEFFDIIEKSREKDILIPYLPDRNYKLNVDI
ncbi:MAG: hypothetical protein ACI4NM_11470, partial [Bullifex sp.]